MTVTGLMLIAIIIMKLWPETASARWLQQMLVVRPFAFLAGITRQQIILMMVTFVLLIAFSELGAPQMATLVAVDVSMVVDAMITVWTIAALTRVKGSWTALRALLPVRGQARPRRRRNQRNAMAIRSGANDDEHPGAFAHAA